MNGVDELLEKLMESSEIPQRVSNRLLLAVILDVRTRQKRLIEEFDNRINHLEQVSTKREGVMGAWDKYGVPVLTAIVTATLLWFLFGSP